MIERLQQSSTVVQPHVRHAVQQAEVTNPFTARNVQRCVGGSRVLRILVTRDSIAVFQTDIRGQRAIRTAETAHHRAECGTVRRLGKAGVDLLQLVLHRLDELQRADQGQLVGDLRLERHVFTDVEAGDAGLDRFELSPVLDRRIRLEVVHVEVAGATGEADHDDGARRLGVLALRPEPEDVRQRQATQPHSADLEEVAAADASLEWGHGRCFVLGRKVRAWACRDDSTR